MEPLLADDALRCGWIHGLYFHPRHSLTLIAKGTYALRRDAAAEPDPEPFDLAGDIHHDDDPEASLRYDSDFAYHKPRADLLLVGRCHAPGGREVRRCGVGFAVGGVERRLEVVGDRRWWLPFGPLSGRTPPEPFRSMELRYENAFGGGRDKRNPVGRGRRRQRDAEGRWVRRLPNVLEPGARVLQPFSRPRPAGFGPLHRTWKPRSKRLGTYRRKWRRQRWPWLPENFDWAHFNAASPPLRHPGFLRGDESYRLENLHPEHAVWAGRLSGVRARCFVLARDADGREDFREVPMVCDTLWIDAEAERLVLVWRGITEVSSPDFEELEKALFFSEPVDAVPRDAGAARALLEQAIARKEGREEEPETPEPERPRPDVDAEVARALGEARAQLEAAGLDPILLDPEATAQQRLDAVWVDFAAALTAHGETPERIASLKPTLPTPEEVQAAVRAAGFELPEEKPGPLTRAEVERRRAADESLGGLDLSRLDLSGLDLAEADLEGALLLETDLSGANLEGANLADAQAGGARLAGARLAGASLTGAALDGASLAGADLRGARGAGLSAEAADLSRARAEEADLAGATLVRADLSEADLSGAALDAADLEGARLDGARFARARLRHATLEEACGENVDFREADLEGLRAGAGCVLPGARLDPVRAPGSIWAGADLRGARLDGAELSSALLGGALLEGASLRAANLPEARLDRADLRDADLARANLFRATLERADLRGADLRGASCYEVEFLDAETAGARTRGANLRMTKLA